jgi:hypothetical protein
VTLVRRWLLGALGVCFVAVTTTMPARASLPADVVVIGVPGLRWSDVEASPELTALVDQANVGSITVKTAGPRTCPIDGWLTISAGTRARASEAGGPCPAMPAVDGAVAGWQSYVDLQSKYRTDADIGLLGALGNDLCGFGPGGAVATARKDGTVGRWWPQFDPALLAGCNDTVVDAGPLPPREGRAEALARVADLVTQARDQDQWVVLAGVADEPAAARREALVAMQLPPDGEPRWLTSKSTRRPGLVQLTDLTATLLSDSAADTPLDGAEIYATGDPHGDAAAVIEDRLDTNERFEQPKRMLVPVTLTLLAAQLLALAWYKLRHSRASRRTSIATLLTLGGFFSAVFLSTVTNWWRWPRPGLALYFVTLAISVAIAAASYALLRRRAALGPFVAAYVVLLVDAVLGTPLQVGSMFAGGPVAGGRLYGFGNSTFPVIAVATLTLAAVAANRLRCRSRGYAALAVLLIGAAGIIADGKPGWGTDFGGVIALTPAVLLLAWVAWRGRITLRAVLGLGLTGFAVVAVLAVLDYQRPPQDRTHFGTFVARLLDGDVADVLIRKLELSLRFFDNPGGWAMLVAVLAAFVAVLSPRRVPSAAYQWFVDSTPMARPWLDALALCGAIAMLVNDFGVVLPAIMLGFLVPLLVAHLVDESGSR